MSDLSTVGYWRGVGGAVFRACDSCRRPQVSTFVGWNECCRCRGAWRSPDRKLEERERRRLFELVIAGHVEAELVNLAPWSSLPTVPK